MADALVYVAGMLGAFYLLLVLAFWIGLHRLQPGNSDDCPTVTVVVLAHNESRNIDACLLALSVQDYPSDLTEVIVVDDRSTDDTACRARQWAGRIPGLRVICVEHQRYLCPKKNALDLGIRTGKGELILTTDADCRPSPGWVASTVRCFAPDVGIVTGYAPLISAGGVLQGLLALQGLVVSALAAGSAGVGFPLTCSGRNLAYRRSAFNGVGGFEAIGHILGGDDVLLMRRIASRTDWKVRFNPEIRQGVPSIPHPDNLFRRQVRYQSKAIRTGIPVLLLALLVYIFHLMLAAGAIFSWRHPAFWPPLGALLTVKTLADGLFLWTAASRFNNRRTMGWFPVLELVAVPYVVLFCALGAFKPLRWK